jgi:hypothetical protein
MFPIGAYPINTYTKENKMGNSSKSGYELRTDLLGMAIGIVQEKVSRQFENEHMKPEGQRLPVAPFTTEDVINEAEKLYMFVQIKQVD